MGFLDWWRRLSRLWHNFFIVVLLDLLLVGCVLIGVPGARFVWEVLTDPLPNVVELVMLQLIKATSGFESAIVGGAGVQYGALFVTLASVHVVVAVGVGFLFDHTPRTWPWRIANYGTLLLVLLALHVSLLLVPLYL